MRAGGGWAGSWALGEARTMRRCVQTAPAQRRRNPEMAENAVECAVFEVDSGSLCIAAAHNAWSRNCRARFRFLRVHIRPRFWSPPDLPSWRSSWSKALGRPFWPAWSPFAHTKSAPGQFRGRCTWSEGDLNPRHVTPVQTYKILIVHLRTTEGNRRACKTLQLPVVTYRIRT